MARAVRPVHTGLIGAAALAGLLLAGCGAGRLLLPGGGRQARLLAQVEERMRTSVYWLENGSLCQEDGAYHAAMLDMLADLAASPEARHLNAETLEVIYNLGVHSTDLPWIGVWVDLVAGSRDEMLVLALWCGEGYGNWTYVIDRAGGATPVAGPEAMPFYALDVDVRWLGDAWAIYDDQSWSAALPTPRLYMVARRNGTWEAVTAFDASQDAGLAWYAASPAVRFDDGHQRMILTTQDGPCPVETTYGWVDNGQVAKYERLPGAPRRPWWCVGVR